MCAYAYVHCNIYLKSFIMLIHGNLNLEDVSIYKYTGIINCPYRYTNLHGLVCVSLTVTVAPFHCTDPVSSTLWSSRTFIRQNVSDLFTRGSSNKLTLSKRWSHTVREVNYLNQLSESTAGGMV